MRDVQDIRRRALRALLAQWGGPTTLAKRLNLAGPSYLSQLTAGDRPITEKTARKIEATLDLPAGWMDQDPAAPPRPAQVSTDVVAAAIRLAGAVLEEERSELPPARFADLVALIYEDALRAGEVREPYVRQLIRLLRNP